MNTTEPQTKSLIGQSRSNVGLGGADAINAWLMTAATVIMFFGALFSHGNWIAVWFAFSGAWFAWRVHQAKKPPNA